MKKVFLSKTGKLIALSLTFVVCVTSAVYPQVYEDYAVFLTLCLLAGTGYALYHIFFGREKGSYAFFLCCMLLMMTFINQMFSYAHLLQVLPWVRKINKGIVVLASLGAMTALFGVIKLSRKIGNQFFKFKSFRPDSKERHEENASGEAGGQGGGGAGDTGFAQAGAEAQDQNRNNVRGSGDRFTERVFTGLFVTVALLVLVSVLTAAIITPLMAGDMAADSLFEFTMNKILALLPYGALALVILGAAGIILVVLVELSKNILFRCLTFMEELRNGRTGGRSGIPLYILSIFIVLALFVLSFKFGDFTLDDFTDLAVDGKYLALPLLLLLAFAVFTLLLWLVHGLLLLISSLNGREIYDKFKSFGNEIGFAEHCKDILKLLFDFLFSTILSVLGFLQIIPDYAASMASLLDICPRDEEEQNKDEKD